MDVEMLKKIYLFAAKLQDFPNHPPILLTPEDCETLHRILTDIASITNMTPEKERSLRLKDQLQIVIRGNPQSRAPTNSLPLSLKLPRVSTRHLSRKSGEP